MKTLCMTDLPRAAQPLARITTRTMTQTGTAGRKAVSEGRPGAAAEEHLALVKARVGTPAETMTLRVRRRLTGQLGKRVQVVLVRVTRREEMDVGAGVTVQTMNDGPAGGEAATLRAGALIGMGIVAGIDRVPRDDGTKYRPRRSS